MYEHATLLADQIDLLREQSERLQRENRRLQREVRQGRRDLSLPLGIGNLNSLRRSVALYCHPDRGGDSDLMARLNALFDSLARAALGTADC